MVEPILKNLVAVKPGHGPAVIAPADGTADGGWPAKTSMRLTVLRLPDRKDLRLRLREPPG